MKKGLLPIVLLLSIAVYSQSGASRICGAEFAKYGLQGKAYSEALDVAGSIHNDCQETVLKSMYASHIEFNDTLALKSAMYYTTNNFFKSKGMAYNPDKYPISFTTTDATLTGQSNKLSREANSILTRLDQVVKNYEDGNDAAFFSSITALKKEALNLPDPTEVFVAGIPVVIADNSFSYWKSKGQQWLNVFTGALVGNGASAISLTGKEKCKVKLAKLGGADVMGAISGAYSGAALGPGGAFAGAVLTSSTSSLANLTSQVLNCLFSWWPF